MKHHWTTEEIRTSTEYFVKTFIVQKRQISLAEATWELQDLLPHMEASTLKMHLSNSKALADEMGFANTANFGKLEKASKTHRAIFSELVAHMA